MHYFMRGLISLCVVCMSCDPDDTEGVTLGVGDPLPTFAVTMNDGTSVATSDLKGRPSVIVFFATYCPDCKKELPELQRLWNVTDREEIPILLISRAQTQDDIEPYWQSEGFTMTYSPQPNRTIISLLPHSFLAFRSVIVKASFVIFILTRSCQRARLCKRNWRQSNS